MEALPLAASLATALLLLAATWLGRSRGYHVPYRVALPLSALAGVIVGTALQGLGSTTALRLAILLGFAAAVGFVHYLDAPAGRWATRLRSRLLLGVPWGTLVGIGWVVAVYLFLQGGINDLYGPVTLPFTSWSYFYPLGVVTAPFAHSGFGHLTGNLVGTVALAPIAEYAWSHFPTGRGESTFSSWRTNPYVRAFVLFPLGVVVVGLATSVFAWGAVIGFSGVVFAFAGFAVVRYPVLTVVALTARGAIATTVYALRDPVVVGTASPSFGPPWWVGIAVQGHLLGLLLGAVIGVVALGRREHRPSAGRLFVGVVVLAFDFTLYAIWWYRDPSTFVLFRAAGILLIVALAGLLAAAVRAGDTAVVEGVTVESVTRQQVAVALLVLPLVTMAMVAVPLNSTTVEATNPPQDAIAIGDYHVYYAEDVENERVGAIPIEAFNETTSIRASGVIVVSESRDLWTEAAGAGELAFWGERSIRVGGIGWRSSVSAKREGWEVAGGTPVYHVFLRPPGGEFSHVFASENDTAGPTIAHRNVTVVPRDGEFDLVVTNGTTVLGTTSIPAPDNSTRAGGLVFRRQGDQVFAERNGTRVLLATKETYE